MYNSIYINAFKEKIKNIDMNMTKKNAIDQLSFLTVSVIQYAAATGD